ncbi:MAG: elongation factor G [Rhodospirillales bacterium]|nr:elongation factor G [Rhodospirillales bacterium]
MAGHAAGHVVGRTSRAVALIGPMGGGKSTLFDALLEASGGPARRIEARARSTTTETRIGHCRFLGDRFTLLDCPGSIEFLHDSEAALAIADLAVLVCDPVPARAVTLAPLLHAIADAKLPFLLFVNRIDTLEGSVRETLAALGAMMPAPLALRQVPLREGGAVAGYVDLVRGRAYRYRRGTASEVVATPEAVRAREAEARTALIEALADHDDALLEKLLEDIPPTEDEIYRDLHKDLAEGRLIQVLLGAAEAGGGVRRLWKALRHDAPEPARRAARLGLGEAGGPVAQIFRTAQAGHAGRLAYARIWRGMLREGMSLGLAGGESQRLAGLLHPAGTEWVKTSEAELGEVVALARLDGVRAGAVLSEAGAVHLDFPTPPAPVYALAIAPRERRDDVKLSAALHRLIEDDPALSLHQSAESAETVLCGQGEMHLNAALERLGRTGGIAVATAPPATAYRETIRRAVTRAARLKRQTGGHGQFADVTLTVAPRARGEGFQFIDRIVGGAVPRAFIPAIGEAAEEAARKGPFGHPVVDLSVALIDGGFHSVDSSDMAFRTATRMAMAEALAEADPVLLEPVEHVAVDIPNAFTARAQRILSGRRGQILGYAERPGWPGWDRVEALVPAAELHDLIIELRSQTLGLGTYRHRFDHLAETRADVRRAEARADIRRGAA